MRKIYSIVIFFCLPLSNNMCAEFVPEEQGEPVTDYNLGLPSQMVVTGELSAISGAVWYLSKMIPMPPYSHVAGRTRKYRISENNINICRALSTWVSAHETINYARYSTKACQDGNAKEFLIDVGTMAALADCTARNYTGSTITNKLEIGLYTVGIGYATYQQFAQAYAAYKNKNMLDAAQHAGIGVGLCIVGALPLIGTDYFIGKK